MGKASGNTSITINLIGSPCLEKMSPLDETETTSILSFVARDPCGALTEIFFRWCFFSQTTDFARKEGVLII